MLSLSFGSLTDAVMLAGAERVRDGKTLEALAFLRTLIQDLFSEPLPPRTPLPSRKEFEARLKSRFTFETTERLDVIFLDGMGGILAEETMSTGTVDETPFFPRELAKKALTLGAVRLILIHNHPSGNSEPSRADIELTRRIHGLFKGLGIFIMDHFIVAREGVTSLRERGLM